MDVGESRGEWVQFYAETSRDAESKRLGPEFPSLMLNVIIMLLNSESCQSEATVSIS